MPPGVEAGAVKVVDCPVQIVAGLRVVVKSGFNVTVPVAVPGNGHPAIV